MSAVHVREQIRKAVQAVLTTVPGIETVCSASRIQREFQAAEFPVAAIGISESVEIKGKNAPGSRLAVRSITVSVSLAVRAADEPEDALDALSVSVEKVLADPIALGIGGLLGWQYVGASYQLAESEQNLAVLEMSYACSITTTDSTPETNIHAN